MSREAQLAVRVHSASNIPQADRFSKTDAYIKIIVPGVPWQKTETIDNNLNPTWDKAFAFNNIPIDSTTGVPSATITFELWDDNSLTKDTLMGTATVALTPAVFGKRGIPTELPFSFTKSKWSTAQSFLRVSFSWFPSFESVFAAHPQAFGDRANQRLYLPLPFGPLVLGIEYEKDAVDVKLYITQPGSNLYLDMVLSSPTNHKTKLRRRETTKGIAFYQNMEYYEELKLDNVPFWEDLNQLHVLVMSKKLEEKQSLDDVVSRHGWKGAMGWGDASKKLHDVELDHKGQEIYMPMPGSFIVVDFDDGNVDMKCKVLETPENANNAYDLTIVGNDVKKASEVFVPAKFELGKYAVQRTLELDDVPYGTLFSSMMWYRYSLQTVWVGTLNGLLSGK